MLGETIASSALGTDATVIMLGEAIAAGTGAAGTTTHRHRCS